MPTEILLDVRSVRAGYGSSPILQGVDFQIRRGEIVAVIGRNGVGKTTAMRCLIGQLPVWQGSIHLRTADITGLPAEKRAQAGIGYIPQGREVFPRMTVEENLQVGEMINGAGGRKLHKLVYEYFPILAERRRQAAGTMSGGQQQQLAIGRALIGNPDLLLLDEPSEGIQPNIVDEISRIMVRINRDLGTTILFVEQNLDMIMAMTQRCYVMDKGRVTAELAAHELTDREVVKRHLQI
ncbi:MAG TPA: ABC transporter ATP-binding protein [Geminicoccus sp.]|uniref:ABC transporter ATP-binding protein n=1 Tax=Geminicoccus sp. TaxID=2024832 RepID=UPI002C025E38|nr:ABC transporter ATP-binding protein [Geminicoccus sp.]HWL70688.1 ABC transporter ATP-binding protein [Geminicoccus sp.]